jgi:hypothetical protein
VGETEPDSNQFNPLGFEVVAHFADVEPGLLTFQNDLRTQVDNFQAKLEACKKDLTDATREKSTIDDRAALTTTPDFVLRNAAITLFQGENMRKVEMAELHAHIARHQVQLDMITTAVEANNSTGGAPIYHDEDFFNGLVRGRANITPKMALRITTTNPIQPEVVQTGVGGRLRALTPPTSSRLEDAGYYHGKISRSEANALIISVGDYLVRESSKNPGELVLSVRAAKEEKPMHFMIKQDEQGKFRFDGDAQDSVEDLVNHYISDGLPITAQSDAKLKTAKIRVGFDGTGDSRFQMQHSDVTIGKKLGNGNFGEVKLGTIVATGMQCAVKTCKDTVPDPSRFLEEADTLKDYDHPNIVKLIGVVTTKPIFILLELCKDELRVHLRQHESLLEVGTLVRLASEAAEGLNYLHSKSWIHRDIAARNCLIGKDGACKISDFGMSRLTKGEEEIYTMNTTTKHIPIKWTAPEALTHMTYVLATDVWAFGILLWEIFSCGKMPYPGMNHAKTKDQVINHGYRMDPPPGTPDQVSQLMDECWQHNEQDRPTMADSCDYFTELTAFIPDEASSI